MAPSTASPQLSSLCLAPPLCLTILTGATGRLLCATGVFITAPVQVGEEQEEELLPPPRPGSSAAAAGSSDGKPPSKTFLPLEDDEDDTGIIPDEEQIRCMLKTHPHANEAIGRFCSMFALNGADAGLCSGLFVVHSSTKSLLVYLHCRKALQ